MSPVRQDEHRNSPHPDSFEATLNIFLNAGDFVSAVGAAPFENLCRSGKGSRYQHLVTTLLAPVIPGALAVFSMMAGGKFGHGLIGMGIFYLILVAFTWRHYFHVISMIVKPWKEKLSREDGKPLIFIRALPRGDTWAMARFVYEPGLFIGLAAVLTPLHIITPLVGGYFVAGAIALIVRSAFVYYRAWSYVRDILDNFNLTSELFGGANEAGSEEQIRRSIEEAFKRVPSTVPREVYKTVVGHAKASLPKELQDLIDEDKD